MKINILLPYKEKFNLNEASSVSITIRNNLLYSRYIDDVRVFGQNVNNPFFKKNFTGVQYSFLSFKSRNHFLADKMLKEIMICKDEKQIIEIHNRPYLVNYIFKKNKTLPISLFFHTDPQIMKGAISIKERHNILKKCSAIFCVSEYIKKQFLEGIGDDLGRVHLLYNGVVKSPVQFPSKRKEILFVGRFVEEKGVDIFVDAIGPISNKYTDWCFSLIGPTNVNKNHKLKKYIYKFSEKFVSIGAQAKLYGYKDNDFVQRKMKSASIIVIPSREEAFGLVVAEAMSNGLAIIASKVGGIPEILGDNGVLIKNINESKLKNALLNLIEDENLRITLQKKAFKNFKFSSDKISELLDDHRKFIFQENF